MVLMPIINALLMPIIAATSLIVTSPSFRNGEVIPTRYTCKGENTQPAITIKDIPAGTVTIALIVEDPDASNGTFDHWVAWNIPPTGTIEEESSTGVQGKNGGGKNGYTGPCPPAGSGTHHYHFKLYALDKKLDLPAGSDKAQLQQAMKGHILAEGELVGLVKAGK
jgi:Raf kinase inhibitor-like YbhB/YbcL family protein